MSRTRATKQEVLERKQKLVKLAYQHGPASVRQIYYRAVVAKLTGIDKTRSGYNKVQRELLALRRQGAIPYRLITDGTRQRSQVAVWDGPDDLLNHVAQTYRRNLWTDHVVEVWVESDSIKGSIWPTAAKWAVPVYTCRGQSSESFVYESVEHWHQNPDIERTILYVGDHDPAGLEIEQSLLEKIDRFNDGLVSYDFRRIAVTWDQVTSLNLPGSPPKKSYGYPLAVEAEALDANDLRAILDTEIEAYADQDELKALKVAEKSERELLGRLAGELA